MPNAREEKKGEDGDTGEKEEKKVPSLKIDSVQIIKKKLNDAKVSLNHPGQEE